MSRVVAVAVGQTLTILLLRVNKYWPMSKFPGLVFGIDSDVLYPLKEQKELADWLPLGRLEVIHSDDGHGGFLLEQDQVAAHTVKFLDQHA
jgi:homoserine acetyltransferase